MLVLQQGGCAGKAPQPQNVIRLLLVVYVYDAEQNTFLKLPSLLPVAPVRLRNATLALHKISEGRDRSSCCFLTRCCCHCIMQSCTSWGYAACYDSSTCRCVYPVCMETTGSAPFHTFSTHIIGCTPLGTGLFVTSRPAASASTLRETSNLVQALALLCSGVHVANAHKKQQLMQRELQCKLQCKLQCNCSVIAV